MEGRTQPNFFTERARTAQESQHSGVVDRGPDPNTGHNQPAAFTGAAHRGDTNPQRDSFAPRSNVGPTSGYAGSASDFASGNIFIPGNTPNPDTPEPGSLGRPADPDTRFNQQTDQIASMPPARNGVDDSFSPDDEEFGAQPERPKAKKRSRKLHLLIGLLVLILLGAAAFLVGMFLADKKPTPVITEETPTPTIYKVNTDDLWAPADLADIDETEKWFISETVAELSATSPQVACIAAVSGNAKPLASSQRTLSTRSNKAAALQQTDTYDSETTAQSVYDIRVTKLASCKDSPVHIVGATAVSGIADAATQVTISNQGEKPQFHTVLVTLTGSQINMFDVVHTGAPVAAEAVAEAASKSLERSCKDFGTCPTKISTTPIIPPKAAPAGWLIAPDWPQITPDTGLWTATEPGVLKAVGTGCEDLTLSTVKGPTERQQRTYLLTQDPKAPKSFGADELIFTFADAKAAKKFADQLGENIKSCPKRLLTANVAGGEKIAGKVGETTYAGDTFTVTQTPTEDSKVLFYTSLITVDKKVIYLVVNTTESFKVDKKTIKQVAVRAAQRATQKS
ncbi:MAG: hypothetical protein CR979_01445 [Propionibacterium sp.]|nr:MAG: hypothetical protein CR979_01445 [Propionibacterium sp.]